MLEVVVTRRATSEILEAAEWWSRNRPAAPELFRTEIARSFQLVAVRPEIGSRSTNRALAGVR